MMVKQVTTYLLVALVTTVAILQVKSQTLDSNLESTYVGGYCKFVSSNSTLNGRVVYYTHALDAGAEQQGSDETRSIAFAGGNPTFDDLNTGLLKIRLKQYASELDTAGAMQGNFVTAPADALAWSKSGTTSIIYRMRRTAGNVCNTLLPGRGIYSYSGRTLAIQRLSDSSQIGYCVPFRFEMWTGGAITEPTCSIPGAIYTNYKVFGVISPNQGSTTSGWFILDKIGSQVAMRGFIANGGASKILTLGALKSTSQGTDWIKGDGTTDVTLPPGPAWVKAVNLTTDSNGFAQYYAPNSGFTLNGAESVTGNIFYVMDGSTALGSGVFTIIRDTVTSFSSDSVAVGLTPVKLVTNAGAIITETFVSNSKINGYYELSRQGDGTIRVSYMVTGLVASTSYTWNFHEFSDGTIRKDDAIYGRVHSITGESLRSSVTSDASGTIRGDFIDSNIKLNGVNSVIGRSIVIKLTSTGARVASGSVFIKSEDASATSSPQPDVYEVTCSINPLSGAGVSPAGFFIMTQGNGTVRIRYAVSGLAQSTNYRLSVSALGDLSDSTGLSGIGSNISDSSATYQSNDGTLILGDYIDTAITKLSDVIGRVITLKVDQTSNVVGYCSPGISRAGSSITYARGVAATQNLRPNIVRVTARLRSMVNTVPPVIIGYIEFSRDVITQPLTGSSSNIFARYFISGLAANTDYKMTIRTAGDVYDLENGMTTGMEYISVNSGGNFTSDSSGRLIGTFVQSGLEFNGAESIVGLSIVVDRVGSSRAAIGVFGITQEDAQTADSLPSTTRLACVLSSLRSTNTINGWIDLVAEGSRIRMNYYIHGFGSLSSTNHSMDVVNYGDLLTPASVATSFKANSKVSINTNTDGSSVAGKSMNTLLMPESYGVEDSKSLIGRAILLSSADTTIQAGCVVGRVITTSDISRTFADRELRYARSAARCDIIPASGFSSPSGTFTFNSSDVYEWPMNSSYTLSGFTNGFHRVAIYSNVNYWNSNFLPTGNLFGTNRSLIKGEGITVSGGSAARIWDEFYSELYGPRSILGKTIVVFSGLNLSNPNDTNAVPEGYCVVYSAESEYLPDKGVDVNAQLYLMPGRNRHDDTPSTSAMAVLKRTDKASSAIEGLITFESKTDNRTFIRIHLSNLNLTNTYSIRIFDRPYPLVGAKTVRGLQCYLNNCRNNLTSGFLGQITDGGLDITRDNTNNYMGFFIDNRIALYGANSIVGYSVVVLQNNTSGNVVAQGVVISVNEAAIPGSLLADSFLDPPVPTTAPPTQPTSNPTLQPPQNDGMSKEMVIGISAGAGGFFVFASALAGLFICRRRRALATAKSTATKTKTSAEAEEGNAGMQMATSPQAV